MLTELAEPALEFVYFYCHGQRQEVAGAEAQTWLSVGTAEVITPGDLFALDRSAWPPGHWRRTAPLVFINGCHTVDITPRTLVQFVDAFADVYAAGVIGTEITLHQRVAGEAAERLWRGLAVGDPVGVAMRAMRLGLLTKGNLMGLAYTAYCSADLFLNDAAAVVVLGRPNSRRCDKSSCGGRSGSAGRPALPDGGSDGGRSPSSLR